MLLIQTFDQTEPFILLFSQVVNSHYRGEGSGKAMTENLAEEKLSGALQPITSLLHKFWGRGWGAVGGICQLQL